MANLVLRVGLQAAMKLYNVEIPIQLGTFGQADGHYFRPRNICTVHTGIKGNKIVNSDISIFNQENTFHNSYRSDDSQIVEIKKEVPEIVSGSFVMSSFSVFGNTASYADRNTRNYATDPLPTQGGFPLDNLLLQSKMDRRAWDDTATNKNTLPLIANIQVEPIFDFDLVVEYLYGDGVTTDDIKNFLKTFFKATPSPYRKSGISIIQCYANSVY